MVQFVGALVGGIRVTSSVVFAPLLLTRIIFVGHTNKRRNKKAKQYCLGRGELFSLYIMDSIDVEYQMWFAGSALSDTLIAISMIILVILN